VKTIIYPWRKLTIGIDGVDGVGKSPLARFLSWQLGMPSIETDMFLEKGETYPSLRYSDLKNLIEFRHTLDRPLIIEGLYLLQVLDYLEINPDILIYVASKDFEGSFSFRKGLKDYRNKYKPQEKADYIYDCSKEDFK
jgi:hypothetical protein